MSNFQEKADFIWGLADMLRGNYLRREYPDVILPMVVIRRLDLAMAVTRDSVRQKYKQYQGRLENLHGVLSGAANGSLVYNTSEYDWDLLSQDPNNLAQNLIDYLNGFSPDVQDIIEKFDFRRQVSRLQTSNLLYPIFQKFKGIHFLNPEVTDNHEMGSIFEHLIYRFNQDNNETAGEHFTPREVIRLMVRLLLLEDKEALTNPNAIITIYDPACGTGGMLTEAKNFICHPDRNPKARVELFGQEINPTAYAVAKSDFLLKGEDPRKLIFGNSFSEDGHLRRFRHMLSNPPFGVDWRKVEYIIKREQETKGFDGRFGAGLPRINDGSLLFLQHMLSKRATDEPSRIVIVFNGSPLFTGDAGSGESNIRRWIIEHDWLEGIVALPDQLFYNTGISTYLWVLTNRKHQKRKGKMQLVNATSDRFYQKMRKSLNNKRNEITDAQIDDIAQIYHAFEPGEYCRVFDNEDFGYRRIRVERPLRLNFSASPERIERLYEQKAFEGLTQSKKKKEEDQQADLKAGQELQRQIVEALQQLPFEAIRDPKKFLPLLEKTLKPLKLKKPIQDAVLKALTERDPEAKEMPASKGDGFEPDPDLRDYENVPLQVHENPEMVGRSIYDEDVPLKQDIYEYFEKEVKPYVNDAWIDESYKDEQDQKTGVVGYTINFNRYFYKYEPPESLDVIEEKIAKLEEEIAALLKA
ncbi:MAG: SAM-dependent DNA methyltransferase [Chroococcidiopsidaceae cyanobacterium CP_BM_RX_35]|nr:SAM-dependent DNA methyltransferase [Chroococcidiopsidaceae cyanobacterium CP_BM_RX_35]